MGKAAARRKEKEDVERQFVLVVDAKQQRPGCAIMQALFGGDSTLVSELFNGESWVLAPNKDMRRLSATKEEWRQFAEKVNKRFPMKGMAHRVPRRRQA